MSHKARAIFLFLTIVAVMFASAVGTTNVYADDGTPPAPPTEAPAVDPSTDEAEPVAPAEPAEVAPPAEEPAATEAAVAEPEVAEPVATDPAITEPEVVEPVATEPAVTEEAAPVVEEQQPAEAATEVETILEQVPDDTTVTVINAEGEAQPLTTQESADAILTGDPIWCPEYQDPTPGANGCTDSFSSFDALLSYLKAHEGEAAYQQSGKIFVQMGTYAGPETTIDFNTYNFQSLNQYNLAIQGGWDTSTTTANSNPANPTKMKAPIVVGTSTNPWVGSLSFDGIQIINANGTGLTLYSAQDITLTNMQVTGSNGGGASLNAGGNVTVDQSKFNNNKKSGAEITAGGYVYVTNSEFNNNKDKANTEDAFGLKLNNQGEVFLDSVYANSNEYGAKIDSTGAVTVFQSFFNGNIEVEKECVWIGANTKSCHWECKDKVVGGYGLNVATTYVNPSTQWAAVYVSDVTANENYQYGAHIEAADAEIYNSVFMGTEKNQQGYGLEVLTTGAGENGVKIDNVRASNNEQFGANIQAVEKVTISNSFFDGNTSYSQTCGYAAKEKSCHWQCTDKYTGYGLRVVTTANINLAGVSAQDNYEYGAHLEGKNVSISNGIFSGNASDSASTLTGRGLEIVSSFDTTLSNVQANNNQLFGAHIQAGNDVNISLSTFSGQVVYTYSGDCTDADKGKTCTTPQPCVKTLAGGGYGLEVIATGTTSDINLSGVTASDNYLFGIHLVATNVKIAGNGSTPTSAERNKEGIKIEAQGKVLIDNLVASNNTLSGATILSGLNQALDGSVTITNSFFSGNASYTSSCKGKTYSGYGLRVVTTGDDITIDGVEANDNYLYGAYLEGGSIKVSNGLFNSNGTNNQSDHFGSGLQVVSTGTDKIVNLNNVHADGNRLFGADIKADGYVSVTSSTFTGNQSYYTDCSKSSGSSSGGSSSGGKGGKTCQNCKTTYDGYGLKIVTTGNIYLADVKAEENYLFGAHLEGANVTVEESIFSGNVSPTQQNQTPTGRGLEVISTGNTTLWNVKANDNQLFGADIQAGGNVVVSTSLFNNNKYYISSSCGGKKGAGYGLKVTAAGTIYLGPVVDYAVSAGNEASGNGAEGAILNGQTTVEVVDSLFNNNGANGLTVTANDEITLTNVEATGNKGSGAEVKGVCTSAVHVDGGKYASNSKYGLKIVDTTYDEVSAPTFGGNGSGDFFQSGCVTNGGGSGSGGGGNGGNSGGNHGWNWYWWWFWHHGFGHR